MTTNRKSAKRLDGQVAIVTGSDSGIGKAIAVEYAEEGANVVVTYHSDREGAEDTCKIVRSKGQRAHLVHLDVQKPEDVRRLFDETAQNLGAPTILVNNAGVPNEGGPVKDLSYETFSHIMRVNIDGPFLCCREFLNRIENSGKRAVIINITSVHEDIPMPGAAAYDASKGALRNLTRTLALEVAGKGINVNNIAPGMILTPMNQEAVDDMSIRREREKVIPMQRAGKPEEIAHAAVFLASDEARYINGTTLVIDGGLTLSLGQGA